LLLAAAGGDLRVQQVTGFFIIAQHPIKMAGRKVHLMRPNMNKLLSIGGVDLFQLLELSLFGSR
jgi:hypothetical protein